MNSVHRVGVGIAAIVAAITVSGAVIVRGAAGAPLPPDQGAAYAAAATPKIIYVSAARPTPVATPAPPTPTDTPQIIYQVVPGYGDDDGGGGD
jgi:hypothetical protein